MRIRRLGLVKDLEATALEIRQVLQHEIPDMQVNIEEAMDDGRMAQERCQKGKKGQR